MNPDGSGARVLTKPARPARRGLAETDDTFRSRLPESIVTDGRGSASQAAG